MDIMGHNGSVRHSKEARDIQIRGMIAREIMTPPRRNSPWLEDTSSRGFSCNLFLKIYAFSSSPPGRSF